MICVVYNFVVFNYIQLERGLGTVIQQMFYLKYLVVFWTGLRVTWLLDIWDNITNFYFGLIY